MTIYDNKITYFTNNRFSKISKYDKVKIEIFNSTYKFPPEVHICGLDEKYHPIFGRKVFINSNFVYTIPYGLLPLLFQKGSQPLINFVNIAIKQDLRNENFVFLCYRKWNNFIIYSKKNYFMTIYSLQYFKWEFF